MTQGTTLLHKIKINKEPKSILDLYNPFNKWLEKTVGISKIYLKYKPKTKALKNSFIHKITDIYNSLDDDILQLNINKFKDCIKH